MITEDAGFRVVAKRRRTPVITELLLCPEGPPLRYQPGQYVLLGDPDSELVVRSYSVANAPRRDGLISLLVTRVPGGQLSGWVHDVLRSGDPVLLSGPYGSFTVTPGDRGPLLFLAGGSGLAPARALAEAALPDRSTPVVLFFSARTRRDLIDDRRFRGWQRRHPQFCYLRTLTRADGPPPAGRLPAILGGWWGDLSGWRVYISGAPGFVTACEAAARALGARPGRVHTEEFFSEPRPWGAAQPAAATADLAASPRQRRRLVPGISRAGGLAVLSSRLAPSVAEVHEDLTVIGPDGEDSGRLGRRK